jgi:hypothetical protein
MPSNRTKVKRISQSTNNSIESWVRWHCTIVPYLDPHVTGGSPWTGDSSQEFWQKNKHDIMAYFEEWAKGRKRPFERPSAYFTELEEKHPRQGRESDRHYLIRVGALYEFEREIVKKRGGTTKKTP